MKPKVILTNFGLDGHDVSLNVLLYEFLKEDLTTIYLGLYVSAEMITAAAWQEDVDAIGISLHSGDPKPIFKNIIDILKEKHLYPEIKIVGGGILRLDYDYLTKIGLNKAFLPGEPIKNITDYLQNLGRKTNPPNNFAELIARTKAGDQIAASHLMSAVEENETGTQSLITEQFEETKSFSTMLVGVSGGAGLGKSTLIDKLIYKFLEAKKTVGVIVCDPTDISQKGILLGDRLQMQAQAQKNPNFFDKVFIRSLAAPPGKDISLITEEIIAIMKALKKDVIIVETIGQGQDYSANIRKLVDTLIVLTEGGVVQLLKPGIHRLGDIIVFNKADRLPPPASLPEFHQNDWLVPVIPVSSLTYHHPGLDELFQKILEHQEFLILR